MDEPRQSAAAASRYLIPIGLAALLVAYLWPVQETRGPITTTYTRLLGFRFDDQPLEVRQVVGTVILNLTWLAVALTALRRTTDRGRAVVFGAAALLGLSEILFVTSRLVFDQFVNSSLLLSGTGGALLVAGAIAGLGRAAPPEIRERGEGRA